MGGISKQLKRPGYGEGHKRLKFKKYAQRNADGTPKESVFHSDPTYLTFFLMFDWYGEHSPLFNGRAVEYLENVCGEVERATELKQFIKILKRINQEVPWTWTQIEGVEQAFKYGHMKNSYRGGEDGLMLTMRENVELSMVGLFDMYQNIAYDYNRMVEVLPHNLQSFSMYVVVEEGRIFQAYKDDTKARQNSDYGTADRKYTAINQTLTGNMQPHFMVKFEHCTFDVDKMADVFAGLSAIEPKAIEEVAVKINFEIIEYYSKQYLNTLMGELIRDGNAQGNVGNNWTGRKPVQKDDGAAQENETVTGYNYDPPNNPPMKEDPYSGGIGEDLPEGYPGRLNKPGEFPGLPADGAGQTLLDKLKDKAEAFSPENLLEDAKKGLVGAAERFLSDKLSGLLLGNVYGLNALSTIQDAFNAGGLNGLRQIGMAAAEALRKENDAIQGEMGDMGYSTLPEIPLSAENIIENVPSETALGNNNINDARSAPEVPLSAENILPNTAAETPLASTRMFEESAPETTLSPENIFPGPGALEPPLTNANIYPILPLEPPLEPGLKAWEDTEPEQDSDLGSIN